MIDRVACTIATAMSSTEDESDINLFLNTASGDSNSDVDSVIPRHKTRGPWFTVVDPNSFNIARLLNFTESCGPVDFEANCTSFDYFNRFVNEEVQSLFDIITEETNLYASQKLNGNDNPTPHARGNIWKLVTKEEISAFVGLIFVMGIVRKPSYGVILGKG